MRFRWLLILCYLCAICVLFVYLLYGCRIDVLMSFRCVFECCYLFLCYVMLLNVIAICYLLLFGIGTLLARYCMVLYGIGPVLVRYWVGIGSVLVRYWCYYMIFSYNYMLFSYLCFVY